MAAPLSNLRWCSDGLKIKCDSDIWAETYSLQHDQGRVRTSVLKQREPQCDNQK